MKKSPKIIFAFLCSCALTGLAQDTLVVSKSATRLIPISITGFTGEADSVLKFDLSVLGMELTTPDKADYLISGTQNGRLEGRLQPAGPGSDGFARSYNGGNTRSQAHAFADDIVKVIRDTPPIFHSKIAFCRKVGANLELFVSDFDGHDPVQMTHDASLVATPAWSPGGRKLFYTSWKSGYTQILQHDAATGNRTLFAAYGGGNFNPAVSPDGRKVAMILSKGGSPNLYVCDSDGANLQQLTHERDEASSPSWSPDGRQICYVVRSGRASLRKISVTGGKAEELRVGLFGNLTSPDWSPDGKKIIFTSGSGNFTLWIAPAAGGEAEQLVAGEDPCWAPNSRTVIFTRQVNHNPVLSLLDVPTKHVKDVGQLSGSCSQPAWAR
ncbi:MAG: LpqB family beta-propeller domain-containing protein [Verrucomicrobiota bacterium]